MIHDVSSSLNSLAAVRYASKDGKTSVTWKYRNISSPLEEVAEKQKEHGMAMASWKLASVSSRIARIGR
jgi:hypothetical protein